MSNKSKPNVSKSGGFERLGAVIEKKFAGKGPVYAKYEFQDYGIRLADDLHDERHKSLYIKLSKEKPRKFLEEAKGFANDYKTGSVNRGKLFMWKLGELEKESKTRRGQNKAT